MNRLTTPKSSANGHSTAAYLQDQIEATRHSMDVTLSRIADRLDPRSILSDIRGIFVNQADEFDLEDIRNSMSRSLKKAGKTIRENPVPAVLSCLVVASFFLPKRFRQWSPEETFDDVAEEAADAKRKLGRKVRETRRALRETAESGKDALADRTASARRTLADLTESGKDRIGEIASRAESKAESYPIGAAVGALAVGFIAALALPGTRKERSVMGGSADRTVSRLKATGSDLADEAKSLLHSNDLDPAGLRKRAGSLIKRSSRKAKGFVEDHLDP